MRDPLTGLFNRRYLEETLERELHRAGRKELALGLIMIDVDRFKSVNDRFGHAGGDAYLRALGVLLRGSVRGSDIVCRYGGEEFLIVLPEAPLDAIVDRAERIGEQARRMIVLHGGSSIEAVTLSMGLAVFPQHGPCSAALIAAADAALYRAKSAGRDRATVADPLQV